MYAPAAASDDESTSKELAELLQNIALQLAEMVDTARPGRHPKFKPTIVLGNRYADHTQNVGAHSDFLGELGPRPIIVGLALGACRDFVLTSKPSGDTTMPSGDISGDAECGIPKAQEAPKAGENGGAKEGAGNCIKTVRIPMPHNSAVIMWGECQERWEHAVPACSSEKAVQRHPTLGLVRYSLTFRMSRAAELARPKCSCGKPAELKFRGRCYRWICAGYAPRGDEHLHEDAPPLPDPCSFDMRSEWAHKEAARLEACEPQDSSAKPTMCIHTDRHTAGLSHN